MGQTFPWQDPRDTAEARVQPVKERLRARQSISGAHLHNKWSSHSFCSARMHATRECIHSGLISTRQRRVRETGREGGRRRGGRGGGYLLEWHSANTNSMSVSKTPERVCGAVAESIVAERSALEASAFKSIPPNN